MTKRKSSFIMGVSIVIFLLIMAGIISGCTVRTSDIPPETTPGGSTETELLNALNEDQLSEEERESLAQQLLENYVFYQGRVTVFENQKWISTGPDGSSGVGDSTVSTDEILVYDAETKKTYIVVRYMSCSGAHRVTVNDMHGDFLQNADLVHAGELYEYYGTGLLWKKTLEVASASSSVISQYTLNFAPNPVRIDNGRNVIFSYPLPRQIDWVNYTSIAGTERRGGVRIWTPEENAKNTELSLVPALSDINASNTYNASESAVYKATGRTWIPSGTFSYNYYKISYKDAMSEIERLERETAAAGSFGAMAENLPSAWQETAAMADKLSATASAVQGADAIVNGVLPQDIITALEARNAAEIVANDKAFQDFISKLDKNMANASAGQGEPGTPRSLEGVIIETSEESGATPQQKNLKNSYNAVKPHLEGLYTKYTSIYDSLQQTIAQIKTASSSQDFPFSQVTALLQDCQQQVQAAVKLNQQVDVLLGDIGVILYDLDATGEVDDETAYEELNRLFGVWQETFETMENTSIDITGGVELPDGYPLNIVPIMNGAIIAIAQRVPGEDGGQDGFMLTLKTNATVDEVTQYYTNLLKNEEDFSSFSFGDIITLSGIKNGYDFAVMVMPDNLGGDKKTSVQINVTPVE